MMEIRAVGCFLSTIDVGLCTYVQKPPWCIKTLCIILFRKLNRLYVSLSTGRSDCISFLWIPTVCVLVYIFFELFIRAYIFATQQPIRARSQCGGKLVGLYITRSRHDRKHPVSCRYQEARTERTKTKKTPPLLMWLPIVCLDDNFCCSILGYLCARARMHSICSSAGWR